MPSHLPVANIIPACGRTLCASRQAHRTHRDQGAGALVERQVNREEDIPPIVVQVHRQVDQVLARRLVGLHPSDLRRVEANRLTVVEHELVSTPGRALEDETYR